MKKEKIPARKCKTGKAGHSIDCPVLMGKIPDCPFFGKVTKDTKRTLNKTEDTIQAMRDSY